MRRLLSILIVMIVGALAFQGPAAAVTGGQPDGDAHPQVALLLAPVPSGGSLLCSGTLIAPTVILTAAHCTYGFSALGATVVNVSFDSAVTNESTFYTSTTWAWHPEYVDSAWPFTVDVGVVILDEPVDLPLASLPGENVLGEIIPERGASQQDFVDVGYGQTGVVTGGGPPQPSFPLERRQSTQRYHPGGNNEMLGVIHGLTDLMLMLKANPSSRHGSGCGGDSGGPIFLSGTYTIVAIHTGGYRLGFDGALCGRLSSLNHRIDTSTVLSWLDQFV
jgi:Trypsin